MEVEIELEDFNALSCTIAAEKGSSVRNIKIKKGNQQSEPSFCHIHGGHTSRIFELAAYVSPIGGSVSFCPALMAHDETPVVLWAFIMLLAVFLNSIQLFSYGSIREGRYWC